MQRVYAALAALVLSSVCAAQLTPIPQFTGTDSETFEGPLVFATACMPARVFNNQADLCTPNAFGCLTQNATLNVCVMVPHGGSVFFLSIDQPAQFTFDTPAYRFGGWFGSNTCCADATFTFTDINGNVTALVGAVPNDCNWHWLGWDVGGGTPIKSILVTSNTGNGSLLDMDDLEVDFGTSIPPPTAYCTAGTSSNGCVPAISANANPSVTFANACNIAINTIDGQKTSIVFYGINQGSFAPHPWATGSSSFLCVKNPTQRTGISNTNGTSGSCNGALVFDWNAYQSSHPTALGNPFAAGQKIYVQGWYRDPPAPKTTNLSDALELTCVP